MRRASRLVRSDYLPLYAARSYAVSAKGTREQINQDSYLAADYFPATGHHLPGSRKHMPSMYDAGDALYVIADGEGEGHAGSRASGRAVEAIEDSLRQAWASLDHSASSVSRQVFNFLRAAFDRGEDIIRTERIAGSPCSVGLTAVAAHEGKLYLACTGQDNQAYLWRAGVLYHLTTPPTNGGRTLLPEYSLGEILGIQDRSLVVNHRAWTQLKLRVVEIEPNDYVLLCTKGLVKHVRDHIIRSTISATPDPQRICDSLFAEAGKYPVPEDLTMIVVRFALTHA